ncbi:MAG: F0F1 ATP synthase subunit delta [Burkholderiales bacterium]
MAELATIARPYADALFKATGAEQAGTAQAWLDGLATIARDPQLLQLASDPNVRDDQVVELVGSIAQGGDGNSGNVLPEAALNFLRIVVDNGRLAALPEIASQFKSLNNRQSGSADAVVYSAFPIDDAALQDLSDTLEKRFDRKLKLSVQEQPELIGGIRIVVGDEVLDTSVRARLEQMKLAMNA